MRKNLLLILLAISSLSIKAQVSVNANSVISFSSQYSTTDNSAAQATGAPNTALCGDYVTAWTQATPDGGREFIELGIPTLNAVTKIEIVENQYPGSIDTVYVRNKLTGLWINVYQSTAADLGACPLPLNALTINTITFTATAFPVDAVRIALATDAAMGASFTEIDAITVTGATLLRLNLVSFAAQQAGSDVTLKWITSSEINNDRFEIERSTDGRAFTKIGTVAAKNYEGQSDYQFTDNSQWASEKRFYRLKMIDKSGQNANSQIIKISSKPSAAISIYPNPAHDYINITGTTGVTEIQLADISGRVISSWKNTASSVSLKIGEVGKGVYMLRLISNNGIETQKINIQ